MVDSASASTSPDSENAVSDQASRKASRSYRQGMKYHTMKAEARILHKCDLSRIPLGSTIIKTELRSTFHYISRIEEHRTEYVTYRTRDGCLVTGYCPLKKDALCSVAEIQSENVLIVDDAATVDMLVELVFNAYMLETPVYRDMIRLFELKFNVSRQTILNWLFKGASALKQLLPVLKAQAFEKDSIVNCDETWCRVKMADKYKKVYIWCMVNKAAGIVIFFYDEGSRSRNGSETTGIIAFIWMELPRLLDDPLPKSDLLSNALNYLKHAWTSVMAYRYYGRYYIDNSMAERSLRTLTIERKNKMAFGSHKGAESSSVYHTSTATCKLGALSFCQFLKNYLIAFMEGRTDFENLTPAILGKNN